MAKTSKIDRKPAALVKCPYCDHQGSSRGLFSHVRLAHQGKTIPKTNEWKKHPYSVDKKQIASKPIRHSKAKVAQATWDEVLAAGLLIGGLNAFIEHMNKQLPSKAQIGYIPDRKNP